MLAGEGQQTPFGRRLPAWLIVAGCTGLSVAAFGARTVESLAALSAAELVVALALCPERRRLAREGARLLAWQTAIIAGLYVLRFGVDGIGEGGRTSWQLFLAFLPGMTLLRSIHEVQILRGARILPRDLMRPWNWPDLVHCVLVPAVIQSLALAGEISLAARARDFGTGERRTYWPGA